MNILLSNYNNDSIALIQWAFLNNLRQVTVVSWDTGWRAENWSKREQIGTALTEQCGFSSHVLKARVGFSELIRERGEFPTAKFQWCATLLKGVPLLQWLNQVDKDMRAQIILPARREALPAYAQLPETLEENEHYGNRRAWHPLIDMTRVERDALILGAGFSILPHRSLECDPCIHSKRDDFQRLSSASCLKTEQLEKAIGKVMFPIPQMNAHESTSDINSHVARARSENIQGADEVLLSAVVSGCGAPYGCGT